MRKCARTSFNDSHHSVDAFAGWQFVQGRSLPLELLASVVLHPIRDLKTRLFRRLCVANARNSGAIAVLCALIRRKIHRFYESHQE